MKSKLLFLVSSVVVLNGLNLRAENSIHDLKPVIIFVEGTDSRHEDWCKESGQFFQTLKHMQKYKIFGQAVVDCHNWKNSYNFVTLEEIVKAAYNLSFKILEYLKQNSHRKIVLIGHDFGNHIIRVASQLLETTKPTNNLSYWVAGPIGSLSLNTKAEDDFEQSSRIFLFEKVLIYNTKLMANLNESSLCLNLDFDNQKLSKILLKAKRSLLQSSDIQKRTSYFIDSVISLGSVNSVFNICMSNCTVGNFYNIYFDFLGQPLSNTDRCEFVNRAIDLRITKVSSQTNLTTAIVARNILFLDNYIKSVTMSSFDRNNKFYNFRTDRIDCALCDTGFIVQGVS